MMNPKQRGITLMELVLAVSIGAMVLAGVAVGYRYAKGSAIAKQQQDTVLGVKAYIDKAIEAKQSQGRTPVPPSFTMSQWTAIANQFPSMLYDPYKGGGRTAGCFTSVPCYTFAGTQTSSPVALGPSAGSYGPIFHYYPGNTFDVVFNVTLRDGTTRSFYGYVVFDTDDSGNILAAAGGDSALQSLSN